MPLSRLGVVGLLVVASVAAMSGDQGSPVNQLWPPGVQRVSAESPVLSPADALKTFHMPPGYHVELVASEPLVQDPVVMDWDLNGRIWVVEMTGFVRDLDAPEPNLDPIGRVVVLKDTNGDGVMDTRTVFADHLVLPRALKVLEHGVLVGEPGNLWLMRDTNGDLHADTKELVSSAYGRLNGGVEGNENSLLWGLDNWIHTSGTGDVYLRLKDGKFDVQTTLSRGEWGATQDDAGRIYRNSNESALHVDLVPTPYFARNPNLLRTRGSYEALDDNNDLNVVWPVRPNPGTNRAYQFGIDRDDGSLAKFTSVCAPLVYRGDRLPRELEGNVFVAEPAANFVSRIIVSDDGTTLRAQKAYEKGEFLASTDERFRPVYLSNAPDGTMYVVDFYRGIIQDRISTTVYLKDHITSRKLDQPTGLGRIYRVMHDTTARDSASFAQGGPAQLVASLAHSNGWRRDTAQRLIVERYSDPADNAVAPFVADVVAMAERAPDAHGRLHALWTLNGIGRITPATVTKALADTNRDVRVAAIRIAEMWLGYANHPMQAEVLKRIDDPDWEVREQLAASIGAMPPGARESAAAAILARHADDPIVMDAALSGLRGLEASTLDVLLKLPGAPEPPSQGFGGPGSARESAISMLAATVARAGQDAAVQGLFTRIADETRPAWQQAALIRGVEIALGVQGATMPGTPVRRGAAAATTAAPAVTPPCPTCPGGRAGPGGAYAFGTPPPAAGSGGRGGASRVRLNREPAAFSALAAKGGSQAPRVTAILARVEWPGKPGAAQPMTPLTADEQRRFDAGADVFKNICQACHQADGRGQDKIAANLIGSPLALGPADVVARILLGGKEGPIGLMPPVGSTLSDEQIAGVLTYIRREWGQAGTPIEPDSVKATRALTAGRTRPWTHDELMRLLPVTTGRGGHQ